MPEKTEKIELGLELKALKEQIKDLEDRLKLLNGDYTEKEKRLIDIMINDGEGGFSDTDGNTYTLKTELYPSIKAETKMEAYQALKGSEFASLVTETVNVRTLASTIKNWRAEQCDPTGLIKKMPDVMTPFVSIYDKPVIKITKKIKK